MADKVSVVIPAKNEANALGSVLDRIFRLEIVDEVIVVNDGSSDDTGKLAQEKGALVVNHRESLGNGAAIKRGFREASGEIVVFMDADGQHEPEDIPRLLAALNDDGADMVVGARDESGQANKGRHLANAFYNRFASFVTAHKIEDLTSGFRVVKADKFRQFLSLLPNGFSYPTTSTMAFFRSGLTVRYIPISVKKRGGKSHIKPLKDGIRFLLIIFKVTTLYSPLKVFLPVSLLFLFMGLMRYLYTFLEMGTFTNMSALLIVASIQTFLMGLVSEQITSLLYKDAN